MITEQQRIDAQAASANALQAAKIAQGVVDSQNARKAEFEKSNAISATIPRGPELDPAGGQSFYPRIDAARAITENITPFDENARREQLLQQNEQLLQSTNAIYNTRKTEELELGRRDLARANTVSVLTGMMGSPEAGTRESRAEERTQKRVGDVEAQRQMAIAQIYGQIDQNLMREKEISRLENRENATNLLKRVEQEANQTLKGLAQLGVSFDDFVATDPQTYESLKRQTGKNDYALRAIYDESLPEDMRKQTYTDYRDNGDGTTTMVKVFFDPLKKTTKTEEYVMDVPYSMFAEEEKPLEVGGKLLVKQPDGSYADVTPYSEQELAERQAEINLKQSQAAKNYADAAEKGKEEDTPTQFGATPQEQINHLDFLVKTAEDAEKYLGGVGASGLTQFLGDLFKGDTKFKQISQYADTIKTNLMTLSTDPAVKKFFGPQMSNADVRLMQSAPTILNPEGRADVFKEELMRVKDLFSRAKAAVENKNFVPMLGPDGVQYNVPADKVDAFIADGGRKL